VMRKIAIFPVKLFISILSNDKNIYFDKRSQFIYHTDNVVAHIGRIYYILRIYIYIYFTIIGKE